jgi:hypothetical protein
VDKPVPNLYSGQIASLPPDLYLQDVAHRFLQSSRLAGISNKFLPYSVVLLWSMASSFLLSGCAGLAQAPPASSPQISVAPSSVNFQNVVVGQKNSQTIQISNIGNTNLNITAVSLVGAGFSLGSLTTPMQLAAGASKSLTLSFTPTSTTTVKGTITIASDDPNSPLAIAVQGTGQQSAASLQITPVSYTFSSTNVQTTSSTNVSLKNTGSASVAISAVSVSGPGFSTTGLSTGTLAPNQQVTFQLNFRPSSAGYVTGTVNISTTSTPLSMAIAGTGASPPSTPPPQHSVTLNWDPSTSNVAGYRVYRGTTSGGPYSLLTSSLVPGTNYLDSSVVSGDKYFYVTTAVDPSGDESAFSNEAAATIPNP